MLAVSVHFSSFSTIIIITIILKTNTTLVPPPAPLKVQTGGAKCSSVAQTLTLGKAASH